MPCSDLSFADLGPELADYRRARTAILPVPFERTTSWGRGTARGPEALLRASHYVEEYDEELDCEPCDQGVATLSPCDPGTADPASALTAIEAEAHRHLAAGKFLITLGGEHTVTLGPARAARKLFARSADEIGVVQFDAHADLRESYEGTPWSHACVMRRLVEDGWPSLAIGLRSLSTPEARWIAARRLPVIWGSQLETADRIFDDLLAQLPPKIYLTFDVDFFDPALVPATGTPEPGGGRWWPTLRLLRRLFESKAVVAMDVVELMPIDGHPASDFTAAKLVMKALAYHRRADRRGSSAARSGGA